MGSLGTVKDRSYRYAKHRRVFTSGAGALIRKSEKSLIDEMFHEELGRQYNALSNADRESNAMLEKIYEEYRNRLLNVREPSHVLSICNSALHEANNGENNPLKARIFRTLRLIFEDEFLSHSEASAANSREK